MDTIYAGDSIDETKVRQWNNKIEKLKEYINNNFPEGCKSITPMMCTRCILHNQRPGTDWHYLCELLEWDRK